MQVPDHPGIAHKNLGPISNANIDVDMIIQNQSKNGTTDFSFTVHRNEYKKAMEVLQNEVVDTISATQVIGDNQVCKVSAVGIGMRSHVGVASLMFETLSKSGVNIQMISTSTIRISVVIAAADLEKAARSLHTAFGLDSGQSYSAPLPERK